LGRGTLQSQFGNLPYNILFSLTETVPDKYFLCRFNPNVYILEENTGGITQVENPVRAPVSTQQTAIK
jgi:hypothetical protein